MGELAWARIHLDGLSHAWPAGQPATATWTALCGVQAEPTDLTQTEDRKCVPCLLVHGGQLADRREPGWR